jgi:hypothetical protein
MSILNKSSCSVIFFGGGELASVACFLDLLTTPNIFPAAQIMTSASRMIMDGKFKGIYMQGNRYVLI